MQFMSGDDVCERADADLVVVRLAASLHGFGVERTKERDGRGADVLEFGGEIGKRARVEVGDERILVLIITGERRLIGACEAQGAITENALGVADVPDDLLDAPLVRLITISGARLVNAAQQRKRVFDLSAQRFDY